MRARKSKPPVVVAIRPELSVSDAVVAERAYYIWLSRDRPVTDGIDDWFAARAELERESRPPVRAKSKHVTA